MKKYLVITTFTLFILTIITIHKKRTNSIYGQSPPNIPQIYHHYIHSFAVNSEKPERDDYAFTHKHALEMGYPLIPKSKPDEAKYSNLGVIKNHQAGLAPIRLRLDDADGDGAEEIKQFKYFGRYHGEYDENEGKYKSIFDESKYVETWYEIDENLINFVKSYGCATPNADLNTLTIDSIDHDLMNNLFYSIWEKDDGTFNVRANYQSQFVVSNLVGKTIETIKYENVDGIFFDYFNTFWNSFGVDDCSNADYNGPEIYSDWYEGQREFIGQIQDQLKQMENTHGNPYFVLANVGNPKTTGGARVAQYWADGSLRIDHYIYEMTTIRDPVTREIILTQDANGVDPETGEPAFIPIDYETGEPLYDNPSDAFLPADKVSINTGVNKMPGFGSELWYANEGILNHPYREDDFFNKNQCEPHPNDDDYFIQHLKASGIAGNQGSWVGYSVGGGVEKKDLYKCADNNPEYKLNEEKEWVFTNDLQILRAIPNWDNLLDIPVPEFDSPQPDDQRKWDINNLVYQSINSYASKDVIYSRHFDTGELFIVFKSLMGEVALKPSESVVSAEFVGKYFERNGENALFCLSISGGIITLKPECENKLGTGIRINDQPSEQKTMSYWDLNENSGTTAHDLVSNYDGIINGARWVSGISGSALEFDGIDDYVKVEDTHNLDVFDGDDFSISVWIKRKGDYNTDDMIVSKRNAFVSTSKGYALQIASNDKVVFEVCDKITDANTDTYNLTSGMAIADSDWHHIVVVFNEDSAKNTKLFIDGVEDSSVVRNGNIDSIYHLNNNKSFIVGALGNLGRPFKGTIDEVRIYDEVLSAEEVLALYTEALLKGDVDRDGDVDIFDARMVLDNYAKDPTDVSDYSDPVEDSKINGLDFGWVVRDWGNGN